MGSEHTEVASLRVLIVDDDPDFACLLTEAVRQSGHRVVTCRTIEEARAALNEHHFDFVVLDQHLPDGLGGDFFQQMRDRGITSPTVMLTGNPDISVALDLTRRGLVAYLVKPLELQEVLAIMRRAAAELTPLTLAPAMCLAEQLVKHAAANPPATVLITGETGTGKEVMARRIHELTHEGAESMPLFALLNCAAVPAEMFEAELFGAERGAYTGAHQQRGGLVDAAQGGTLFLDEIGEMALGLQAKLLHFLESHEYRHLGSTTLRSFSGRIIAATNRPLHNDVAEGRFRADLFYRLDVLSIHLPPLRARLQDLDRLVETLLQTLAAKYRRTKPNVRPEDIALLERHDFPGNIRELRHLLERSLLRSAPASAWLEIDPEWKRKFVRPPPPDCPLRSSHIPPELSTIDAQEYASIGEALRAEDGAVRRSAARLGLTHQALLRRLRKWPGLRTGHATGATRPTVPPSCAVCEIALDCAARQPD